MQTPVANIDHLFTAGKTQILWKWIPADLQTPVAAYLKLTGGAAHSFLLESVEGGQTLGRYSIIGAEPDLEWKCANNKVFINGIETPAEPLQSLRETITACAIDAEIPADLPPMAVSGLFGYIGYDMIRLIENVPDTCPDPLGLPDSILIRPTKLCIFDNVKNMLCLVTPVYTHAGNSTQSAQETIAAAQSRLHEMETRLHAPIPPELLHARTSIPSAPEPQSNTSKPDFLRMIDKAIDYIRQGEIFQTVISQRFSIPFDLPPFELYRSLRRMNPSPFLFHLQMEGFALVGSSPEILVRVRDATVTIRPIAGTRHRGQTATEDQELAAELLADPKERAEHLMLLDLGRNDVGAVSEYGSVTVTDQFMIERYSHVMHIVSNVQGTLKKGKDALDAFFAGFPAGTVSGAPKIRAMEIIDELETHRRSFYAGGIGYFSGNGDIDTCIALRTGLIKDGTLYVQAGGGVVADSTPEGEYQESVNKAKAVLNAAKVAIENAAKPH